MLDGYRKSVPFFQTHFIPWQSLTSSMKPVQFKQTDPILKQLLSLIWRTRPIAKQLYPIGWKRGTAFNLTPFRKKINSQESLLDGVCVRLKGDYERTAFVNPLWEPTPLKSAAIATRQNNSRSFLYWIPCRSHRDCIHYDRIFISNLPPVWTRDLPDLAAYSFYAKLHTSTKPFVKSHLTLFSRALHQTRELDQTKVLPIFFQCPQLPGKASFVKFDWVTDVTFAQPQKETLAYKLAELGWRKS